MNTIRLSLATHLSSFCAKHCDHHSKKRIGLLLPFFVLLCVCFKSSQAMADDYEFLTQKLEAIQFLSGEFVQTMKDDKGEEIDTTKGHFKLLRPGYFLWETKPPQEQLIVSNKQSLSVFDPDLDQVTVYNAEDVSQTPAGILTSDSSLLKEFFIVTKLEDSKKQLETYRMTYRDAKNEDFLSFDITFNQAQLYRLNVLDKLNQTTEIVFSSLDESTVIDISTFVFTPPEGVDVIHN